MMEPAPSDTQTHAEVPGTPRSSRDEDAAFLRAVATLGYFAVWAWFASSWGDDRPLASLNDVVPLGAGLGVSVGLAHYFDRVYLRMVLSAVAMVAGFAFGIAVPLPD